MTELIALVQGLCGQISDIHNKNQNDILRQTRWT